MSPLLSFHCRLPIDKSVRLPNPIGQGHTPGGGEYGPAIAVASHKTDLAIAVDENGSALIPAACTGIYAYRPTAGVLPLEGAAAASATLGTTCLLGHDPKALVRAGRALGLPGAQNTVTVVQYLVAEDIFGLCDPEVQRSAPAVVSAVRRWAGADQAKALNLTEWLFHRIPSLRTFLPPPGEKETVTGKAQTEQVLDALFGAAHAVQVWEWQRSGHGAWVAANKATMPTFLTKTLDLAGDLTEKRYNEAIAVAEELSAAMRAALQEGYVFVMPTVPGPAPRTSGPGAAEKMTAFIERSFRFAALASLAGVPQVVIPMPTAGSLPLSISCVSLQRRDLLLLQAAAKLGPMLAEAAAKLDAPETAPKKPSASSSGKKSDANGVGAANPALAEGAKEQGNTAFNAGRYDEAVRRYSEAIQLNPKMAVYYSNRAMANLKLGQYGAAEEDCDAALKLDPTLVKALLRRGSARLAQGNVKDARDDFTRVLTLEPRNKQAVEELRRLGRESESYATSSFSFA